MSLEITAPLSRQHSPANESVKEAGVPPTQRYHPRYDKKETPTAVTFQTADGTAFFFDLALLAHFSDFFKDLHNNWNPCQDQEHVLLPVATPRALAFAFDAIRSCLRASVKIGGTHYENRHMDEIIAVAEEYNLSIILKVLLSEQKRLKAPSCILFVLAVSIQDTAEIECLSERMLVDLLNPWADRTLKERAPLALVKLYEHRAKWEAFKRPDRHHNFANSFDKACNPHCKNFAEWQGDFDSYAASFIWRLLDNFAVPSDINEAAFSQRINKAVACTKCRARVEKSVLGYLSKTSRNFTLVL